MTKEDVVIENAENNKVYVILFDINSNTPIGGDIGIQSRKKAFKEYNVVGEIYNGEIDLYINKNEDDYDYSDFIDPDLEED